ncbi:hypothetical protein EU510_08390 [Pseudoalteromonas sp. FUC4]|uniref:AbiTii domain-containing protein n=1 Tax=Pseudoalteromonas sp. FUC4 TaxID=2511201 RepID=UPI0011F25DF6|nr:hypothetical protein [Pseudoalteromonas sp. FUC4]KAA1153799.1 hypothetical protein EU510_08390 [Pseudoalteromonas sp. FUC4]
MSLLREIQDAAIDSKTDLASLLRKCKVLSARLGSQEFKAWVDAELSGYRDADCLPEYRIIHVTSKGHFSGAFGSGLNNADIPLMCIPENFRESMSRSNMMEPVAGMEALVSKCEGGTAQEPWNPDFVALVGQKIYERMNCMQAWKVIPITSVIAALDEIRNRILNFVLEIEAQDPEAGEAALNSSPVPPEKVNQIFNTYISGSVQNVATGSHSFEQHATNNDTNAKLFSQLLEALQSVNQPEITVPLCNNIEEMRSSQGTQSFKEHYQHFMSLLSNHMTVLGPVVAPFLPALAAIVP